MKALEVENLVKHYDGVAAVKGVSFEVEEDDLFVIMGPSGCGKTTLLRCIAGLMDPDSGSLRIFGKEVTGVPPHKRGISMIFENFALFPHMNVRENIAFGLRLRGVPKDQIEAEVKQMLKFLGLEGYEERSVRQLSGGEKQRVAIARSLVLKPKILLFDEPLANLDYRLQRRMEEELKLMHGRLGLTFIYVTHNQEQGMSLGDHMMIMSRGVIEQVGQPYEVYHRPRTEFVARFVGEINLLPGKLESVEGKTALVSTEVARLDATAPDGVPIGGNILYGVRPEHARVGPEANDCGVKISAKFVGYIYRGSNVEYLLEMANGQGFKVETSGDNIARFEPKRGDPVPVGWNAENVVVISRKDSGTGSDITSVLYGTS